MSTPTNTRDVINLEILKHEYQKLCRVAAHGTRDDENGKVIWITEEETRQALVDSWKVAAKIRSLHNKMENVREAVIKSRCGY